MSPSSRGGTGRRRLLVATSLAAAGVPLRAQPAAAGAGVAASLRGPLQRFCAGAVPREGRVRLELPEMVENGNAVPVSVSVDAAMGGAERVVAIALWASRNPSPEVAEFRLGPSVGRARVSTRMRLATSQQVLAAARMADGSVWTGHAEVLVTLAACVEG